MLDSAAWTGRLATAPRPASLKYDALSVVKYDKGKLDLQ